jgi:hypothetical protein
MNYLTDRDYLIANQNGIDNANAFNRVYACGWDVERAITEPIRRKEDSLWMKYKEKANQIGITQMCFYQRTYKGMTPEQAATTPKLPHGERWKKENVKLTKEIVDTATRNGIGYKTLKMRVYTYKWDVERAITEPLHKEKRRKSQCS